MEFYGVEDGAVLEITDPDDDAVLATYTANVTAFLAQPAIVYAGNNATGLRQILEQKYVAFFQQAGQEAYFNYRRTGIPAFLTGPGTGNNGVIPKRWLYPQAERTNNEANYNAAVSAQFGASGDNLNAQLWIDQN